MYNIVCLKYGTKYTSEHVNALFDGVKNNTSVPYRFICFTEDPEGLECEFFPIPCEEEGWWGKLSMFKETLYDLEGTLFFIDLDMHINGSLDDYLQIGNPEDLYVMRDFAWRTEYSSAIMRFPIGGYTKVWEHYIKIKDSIKQIKTGDQNIINIIYNKNIQSTRSKAIEKFRLNSEDSQVNFWPDEWQQDIRYYTKDSKAKIIVGYGSAGIFDLKRFK